MATTVTVDLDELRQQLVDMEQKAEELRAVIGFLTQAQSAGASENASSGAITVTRQPVMLDPDLEGLSTPEAARLILQEAGEPLRTAEIAGALEARGYGQELSNLQNSVFTSMTRRDDIFVKVDRGVWALREFACQDGGVKGSTDEDDDSPF